MVSDGALSEDISIVSVLEDNAEVFNGDNPLFPKDMAIKVVESLATLCKVKYGTDIDMSDLSLAEISDDDDRMNQV